MNGNQTSGKRVYMGTFVQNKILGRGGMGVIADVTALPDTPNFHSFLADIISWREATGERSFPDVRRSIQATRGTIDELVRNEISLQDSNSDLGDLQEIEDQLSKNKDFLRRTIEHLKINQMDYVKKKNEQLMADFSPQELISLLSNHGITLPPDLRFAMKISFPGPNVSEEAYADNLRRLQDERNSLINLVIKDEKGVHIPHPNIVTVYSGGKNYYVMELIRGKKSLEEIMDLSIEQKIRIIRDAAKGLAHSHASGLIHRDIKPDNIAVDKDGNVKIIDFGLVKTELGMTHTGTIMGTPDYMPPEQLQGQECDERSDVYSLGAAFYQFITGGVPFTDESGNIYALARKIIHDPVVPPRKLIPAVPRDLNDIIMSMLEKDPSQRPQGMEEVANMLDQYLSLENKATLIRRSFADIAATEILSRTRVVEVRRRRKVEGIRKRRIRRVEQEQQKSPYMWIGIGAGIAAVLGIAGALYISGNKSNNSANNRPLPAVAEEDFSHIHNMYRRLESGYNVQLHEELVSAINRVPEDRRNQFDEYIENALRLRAENDFRAVSEDYDRLRESYENLAVNPTEEGIGMIREEIRSLSERLAGVEGIDTSSVDFEVFDLDRLQTVVDNYNRARELLVQCRDLADSSSDMRHQEEINRVKAEIRRLVNGTENVQDYDEVMDAAEGISLGRRPTLALDFNSPDDLRYLQGVLQADGAAGNGRFNGRLRLEGICSFEYNGRLGNENVEGHAFYNGRELTVNGNTYDIDSINGEIRNMVVYKR